MEYTVRSGYTGEVDDYQDDDYAVEDEEQEFKVIFTRL